jgi:hypothetical protein
LPVHTANGLTTLRKAKLKLIGDSRTQSCMLVQQ